MLPTAVVVQYHQYKHNVQRINLKRNKNKASSPLYTTIK
jgi:hypothetical protein